METARVRVERPECGVREVKGAEECKSRCDCLCQSPQLEATGRKATENWVEGLCDGREGRCRGVAGLRGQDPSKLKKG